MPELSSMCRCTRTRLPRALLAAALALWSAGSALAQPQDGNVQSRFVVLKNGKVFAGQVERDALRVIVRTESGVVIPFNREEVDFVADSIEDAADRLSNRIVDDQPQSHIHMAHWCLENRALAGARRELGWLEVWGVQSPEVDELKRRLALSLKPVQPGDSSVDTASAIQSEWPGVQNRAGSSEANSGRQFHRVLERIHPDLRATFQSDVHMRLVNGCAAARCHGNPSVPMRLWAEGRAGGLNTTGGQRNLIAILEQIDMANPENSPLLHGMTTAHGGQTEPAFPVNGREWEEVRRWIVGVAARQDEMQCGDQFAQNKGMSDVTPAAWQEAVAPPPSGPIPEGTTQPLPPKAVDLLQEPGSRPGASDPFNPDVFNQKYAGTTQMPAARFDPSQLPAAQPVPQSADVTNRLPPTGKVRPLPPVKDGNPPTPQP